MSWEVIIVPVEDGVVVYVFDGKTRSQEGRVAWNRWRSIHKLTGFKRSLRRVVARADAEANRLNGSPEEGMMTRREPHE